ncbi:YybH family protein [Maliponia aquimaris]|uniref:SnoaL-like domain protein n=1 Tax=Maliponia aquimaris TaxID=1673631 RepID=A0A238L0Y8_9RHOB|nr:nuclear transport factor 2 family protein [Maliponia aquimaris]SMX48679.1 SnoaL-like domain protein [Maliponia aquimaris]
MHSLTGAFAAALSLATASLALADPASNSAKGAHAAYLAAINSNDLTQFLETVTDDIVFIAPDSPVMSGKGEVGPWVAGYFAAVETHWDKRSEEFVVSGGWAFERYAYVATDTMRESGETLTSTGHGVNIYRLEDDGVWRVARDIWVSGPVAQQEVSLLAGCAGGVGPC